MIKRTHIWFTLFPLLLSISSCKVGQVQRENEIKSNLLTGDTKPWVYWFLTDASISKKGITRDLEAMKKNGIGGAMLFTIRGAADPSLYQPTVVQLTPEWYDMMKFAVSEAARLGIKLALHACDGFTAAGGPWISPELSMQKVVWTDTLVLGNQHFEALLPQPEKVVDYYEDIATYAYPAKEGSRESSYTQIPEVTCSIAEKDASFLALKGNSKNFTSRENCWIQFTFEKPFTCRSITLQSGWNNYQANRLILETSNDGHSFKKHGRLVDYRHGWDDRGVTSTHLIEPVSARYFRFVFDPEGSEPGAEDLDDAKWRSRLSVSGIELSGESKIHQFEGKTGAVWRIAERTDPNGLSQEAFLNPGDLIDISEFVDKNGKLNWEVPTGNWLILRMGHTSTGATNYIGGGGIGLEADKLNPKAVEVQFENWFDSIYNYVGKDLAAKVIEELYNDSWECGSQNWSPVLLEEFEQRRGYDLKPLLPVMTGLPLKNTGFSEQVLYDIRLTIAEVLVDNYHGTMRSLAENKGLKYSAESVAPVFVSDGMLHFKNADEPTGEFWFRSPSHDKPNDILDAVSAAHIYGKKIIRAEAGTEIRLDWDEHPGLLKTTFDRNFALGVNKMIFHVFTHDPWTDRKPGKTLGVVGTFFQPNQTWWEAGKAWVNYIANCQRLLQQGRPVADIAVFTGEEIPRRAVLPDRLVSIMPGIFGADKVASEKQRLLNKGQPYHQIPKGVTTQQNIADPLDWIDPLKGYAYDSFNKDALLNLASVKDGRIVLPGGASYGLLVIPGKRRMNPEGDKLSLAVAEKIAELVQEGATVLFQEKPDRPFNYGDDKEAFLKVVSQLFPGAGFAVSDQVKFYVVGEGNILLGNYDLPDFENLGLNKDFMAMENSQAAQNLAWTHRTDSGKDIYFISNQEARKRTLDLSFRVTGKVPELYYPVSDQWTNCNTWSIDSGRTMVPIELEANESVFVVFEKLSTEIKLSSGNNRAELKDVLQLEGSWVVQFDSEAGGPKEPIAMNELTGWETSEDNRIKFYSGTATYTKSFDWSGAQKSIYLDLGNVHNLAEVVVNGVNCGVAWTSPFQLDISKALQKGKNKLEIKVTNTWANRLMGDHELLENQRITWTNSDYRLEGNELLPAGLMGPVVIKHDDR